MQLRGEWQLDVGVIEKDYVLGWMLAAIAAESALADSWIFKGGTCLRKCYYETYRFSEDLDFTIIDGGPEEPRELTDVFQRIASWLRSEAGIDLVIDEKTFTRKRNLRGNPTTQARIAHSGPNPQPTLPKLKLDITSDEVLVLLVVNDHGQLRSYRVDRIAGVRPTNKPFKPKYMVEF